MDKQEASKEIASQLESARCALKYCVMLSEQFCISFELPWGGEGTSEAGIGATYYPVGHPDVKNDKWYTWQEGWNPSAGTC